MFGNHAKTAIFSGWILGLGTLTWVTTLVSEGGWTFWTLLLAWGLLSPLLLIRLGQQLAAANECGHSQQ